MTLRTRLRSAVRFALLRLRVYDLNSKHALDPYSPEYLYFVQQQKRIALSKSIAHLRPRYILFFPVVLTGILAKAVDLWLANQLIRSLINERDLLEQSRRSDRSTL